MRTLGALLSVVGVLATLLVAWVWWMRATADVGRPLPFVHVLTAVGPTTALAGGLLLRVGRGDGAA